MSNAEAGSLRIALAQLDGPSLDPEDQTAIIDEHIETIEAAAAGGARLVVFPQLSLAGYSTEAAPLGPDDPRLEALHEACIWYGCIALAGAVTPNVGRDNHPSISTIMISPDWVGIPYSKINLHGSENDRFQPGSRLKVIKIDGWRLGLSICADRTLAHAQETSRLGADAYVVAGVFSPTDVIYERMTEIAKLGMWTMLVNTVGETHGFGLANGGSALWTPEGERIAQASATNRELLFVELSR